MAAALNPPVTIYPLTVEQYHAMGQAGILHSGDPVELLEGIIVQKPAKNPPHRKTTWRVREGLRRIAPDGWYVDAESPITLADSEPEPDVAVIRGSSDDYGIRHPAGREVGLVAEVAYTRDRIIKKRIYAKAGIPFYWLLDLNNRRLEVYSESRETDYLRCTVYQEHQPVEVVLDGKSAGAVLLSDVLP